MFGRKSKVEKSPIEAVEPVEEAEPQVSKNSGYTLRHVKNTRMLRNAIRSYRFIKAA